MVFFLTLRSARYMIGTEERGFKVVLGSVGKRAVVCKGDGLEYVRKICNIFRQFSEGKKYLTIFLMHLRVAKRAI